MDGWMDSLLRKAAAACGLATTGPVAQQRTVTAGGHALLAGAVVSVLGGLCAQGWSLSLAMGVLSRSLVGGGVVRGSVTTPGSPLPPEKGLERLHAPGG